MVSKGPEWWTGEARNPKTTIQGDTETLVRIARAMDRANALRKARLPKNLADVGDYLYVSHIQTPEAFVGIPASSDLPLEVMQSPEDAGWFRDAWNIRNPEDGALLREPVIVNIETTGKWSALDKEDRKDPLKRYQAWLATRGLPAYYNICLLYTSPSPRDS